MRYQANYQDFLETLVEADRRIQERDGAVRPWKPKTGRAWAELPLNLAGGAVGGLLNALPARLHYAFWQKALQASQGSRRMLIAEGFWPAVEHAGEIGRRLEQADGRPPAILVLMSHPPTDAGGIALIRELVAACFAAAAGIRGRPVRARCVMAVDAYALDEIGFLAEGLYAGFISANQIAIDRQSHRRSKLQRRTVLAGTSVHGAAWHILGDLRARAEVVMALSGGVYATGRLLYCLREWLWALYRDAPARPSPQRLTACLQQMPGFAEFVADRVDPEAAAGRPWGVAESWLLSRVAAGLMHESGVLDGEVEDALAHLASVLGFTAAEVEHRVAAFRREFARSIGYRERLFQTLARRVVNRGTPIVLLGVCHGDGDRSEATIARPVGLLPADGGGLRLLEWDGTSAGERRQPVAEFAREWVSASFP